MKVRSLLVLVAALFVACPLAFVPAESVWAAPKPPPPNRPAQEPSKFVDGEILVRFKPGTPAQVIAEAHRQNGGQLKDSISDIDVQVVAVPAGLEKARVAAYRQNPNVQFAELNGLYYAVASGPNDPMVGQQWQYNNTSPTAPSTGGDINAFEAWQVTMGSSSVGIAVLDSGIDQTHEDLRAKLAKTINFSISTTADDRYGHGTHVAGSAAAVTNNGIGVAGTCPNCVLYNVKVLGDDGSGDWSRIARGINWAANNGAKAINMSFGDINVPSSTVESAVNYAWSKGVVLAAAAGNNGHDWGFYPAAYTNVIAVAATDSNDAKASFSNFGAWVDVAAPGASIYSTAPDHANTVFGSGVKYGTLSGTSMASPHVAGLAGLIWSTSLCSTNSCVRDRIQNTANKAVNGQGLRDDGTTTVYWQYGRIDANAAVSQ